MKHRKIWQTAVILCLAIASGAAFSQADDKKQEQTLAQYLEQLQAKLDHTARRVNQPTSEGSSVVGLRGSKQETSASKQLYWKGKDGTTPVASEEVKDYRTAVEQARAGKTTDAIAGLKAFQEKYPKSSLLPDVNETLARLSAAPKP